MTYEQFISRFEKQTKTARGVTVKCPAHEDSTASLSVGRSQDGGVVLKCFAGCRTEEVVSSLGLTMRDLFAAPLAGNGHSKHVEPIAATVKPVIEKTYSYTDALGRELYQAVRLKPKSFRQRHAVDGAWVWSMEGVERVLYRLPEILKSERVWIVEGEKDCDNLAALGFTATCNVGGAGKWLDGYTATLAGKDVILCGDNDEPGCKHMELVFESVAVTVKSCRIVKLPGSVKDASDYILTFTDQASAAAALIELAEAATPHIGGVRMPVYSLADLEPLYKKQVDKSALLCLDIAAWLPTLKNKLRPMVPGEVCLILGDTGVGKTALLQNIALASGLRSLLFELELPPELLFERFLAIKLGTTCAEVETEYRQNGILGAKAIMQQFPNLYVCVEPRLTVEQLESIIMRSELKMGCKPVLVLIDYVQLIQGTGPRYEKTSNVAEGLKVIAKTTRTIIVVASQVARAAADDEIGIHSGKDSGALENSAGLVLGAWRVEKDPGLMMIKVLKSTKGGAGLTVPCNFDGAKMRITERSRYDD